MQLDPLFTPAAIAVVGATSAPTKAGHAMMLALAGFGGPVYPVNPKGGVIAGRTAATSVGAIGELVDLAVLILPAEATPDALAECAAAGARAAVICAGGFAESGPAGQKLQDRVRAIVAESDLRVLGPNTSGFLNPRNQVVASFVPAAGTLRPGPAAIVAQSGGINLALCFLADAEGLGIGLGVGLGNAVDVGFVDVLDHVAADDDIRVVALHVEGVADGRALRDAVGRVVDRKPVVALPVGRSDVGDFARSHTGARAGAYALTRAALEQAGAVVVEDPTELIDAVRALSAVRAVPKASVGVGVVTGQAGPGLVIADLLRSSTVSLPELGPATTRRLAELLPPLTYQRNPVDTGRPAESFADVVAAVAADPAIDVVAIYALDEPGALDPTAALSRTEGAAVALFGTGGPADVMRERRRALPGLYTSPDRLARAARAVAFDAEARFRLAPARNEPPSLRRLGPAPLDEVAAKKVFEQAGLRTPSRAVCASRAEAYDALARLATPVVVKLLDPAVTHKSDVDGVHVGVRTPAELDAALDRIDAIRPGARYLVEEQAGPGLELIVGGVRDAAFGPCVLLGLGGVGVDLAPDPVLRLAPVTRAEAQLMVAGLPERVRTGLRGQPPIDVAAVADAVMAVSDVLCGHVDVTDIDINPLRLTADGAMVLDALIVVSAANGPDVADERVVVDEIFVVDGDAVNSETEQSKESM